MKLLPYKLQSNERVERDYAYHKNMIKTQKSSIE